MENGKTEKRKVDYTTFTTLRESYAGFAMLGLLSNPNMVTMDSIDVKAIARIAKLQADAMLDVFDREPSGFYKKHD